MLLDHMHIGLAITGSFCTLNNFLPQAKQLVEEGAHVTPIFSYVVSESDNKFSTAKERFETFYNMTGNKPIDTISGAEPIGPQKMFDILVVAPCTGNTIAKIANGITDTPVTMAVKSHLRGKRPVVIGMSTNDALGANAKNVGLLLNMKHIFFVPFFQDSPLEKENSLCFIDTLLIETILQAQNNKQLQPLIRVV